MTKLLAIVSEQGTACHEACLCERCHANPEHRADTEKKAARISDIRNPANWQDATGNEALTCNVSGTWGSTNRSTPLTTPWITSTS
jgi:hypothetical protein